MPTRRQVRVQRLVNQYGFLPSEALRLSHITNQGLKAPYIKRMIIERQKLYKKASDEGLNRRQYVKLIKSRYLKLKIAEKDPATNRYKRNKDGTVKISVYKLLRRYQREYEKINLPFDTPTRKRLAKPKAVKKLTHVEQAIRKHQDEIDNMKSRLKFPMIESERTRLNRAITFHQKAIDKIKENK